MKKTSKRVIAALLSITMVFSVVGAGAVATNYLVKKGNTVTKTADGSTVVNANSVEEAVEIMDASPEMFYGDAQTPSANGAQSSTSSTQKDSVIYPTVILPGISQSISYLADENGDPALNADGDELSGGLLIIDESKIMSTIANSGLIESLPRALIYQNANDGRLAAGIYKTVSELFAVQSSDKNGNPVNNLKTVEYKCSVAGMTQEDRDYFYRMIPMQSITSEVGEDNLYLYTFPLIGDPMESAAKLDEYIQFVKEEKGVDKVNIVSISLGGTILTAYLEYMKDTGYTDINRVINVVSLLDGTDIMGDFFLREFNLEDEFLFHDYLPMIMKESEGYGTLGYIINIALKIFPKQVVYTILTAAVDGLIDTLMHNCPQFWAMIPSDRYEDAKAKYSEIWTESEYAQLATKLDAFQTAKLNLKDNLTALNNSGKIVNNVCGYNLDYSSQDYCFFAIMKSSATTNSDAIIDIDSASLGATYAKAGEILDDDILFADDAIVSPDGSIDASTCLFPENVWFFNGQHHEVGRNDVIIKLIGKMITGEIKSVNDMSDAYPQFNGNRNTKKITRWYLSEAESVLNSDDLSQYNAADIAELQAAYDEALALLETTICEPSVADATRERLLNALRSVGVEKKASDETTDKVLETICKFLDDTLYTVFGGNGFSDISQTGPFPGKK